jgi:hypothetical protein
MVRRIAPQTGVAFLLPHDSALRVIDPQGQQVSDLFAFAADDTGEWLSSGRTLDYNETIHLTSGHTLYSNRSNPMFRITDDTVGRHDFLLAPCSQEMFRLLYQFEGHHPSCFENLVSNLAAFGIPSDAISTTFNLFMNVEIAPDGRLEVVPPRSIAGDRIELRARMDLIVGLTACSAEKSNNESFKPIDFEIL